MGRHTDERKAGRPFKTIFWKNAGTKEYGELAKESFLRISAKYKR
jgi:hypothetical protein